MVVLTLNPRYWRFDELSLKGWAVRAMARDPRLYVIAATRDDATKDWDVPTIIKNFEATGFEGVELRTTHAHGVEVSLSKAERADVRKRFADSKVADGTMLRRRLILPGRKTVMKWFSTFGRAEDENSLDSSGSNHTTGDTTRTLWTDTFQGFRKDPEHLPIKNP